MSLPFYERSLDSFSDETITHVHPSDSGVLWYATLDASPQARWPGSPDFSRCAGSREAAIEACARAIRDDAQGIGKYAPHTILTGYGLFQLRRHWEKKEIVAASSITVSK